MKEPKTVIAMVAILFICIKVQGASALSSEQKNKVESIGAVLRCPVCQGMPIADSPATMAVEMMDLVHEKVAAGQSEEEIINYFIGRYGEWVLLKPTTKGFNIFVWILPPLALFLACFFIVYRAKWPKHKNVVQGQETPVSKDSDDTTEAIRREVEI